MAWIGVDLDGTLARDCTDLASVATIGEPIPMMVATVKQFLAEGYEVRIFTARVGPATEAECLAALRYVPGDLVSAQQAYEAWVGYQRKLIELWCTTHLGCILPITATKDLHMTFFLDDRAIQVETNTGRLLQVEP